MERPFVSLTSDFGIQSQGVGIMKGVILAICPEANVVHLMHGLPDYDITCAARTMETALHLPVGCHICVVDPGVGTKRRPIVIQTGRGDYLIGPDNGVLLSAARFLGGVVKVVEISNEQYMRLPVSPIFHGRDIFSPAAAHLAAGAQIAAFGKEMDVGELTPAPYGEAKVTESEIEAQIIHINKFGSIHLNILHEAWDTFGVQEGASVKMALPNLKITIPFHHTFGEVEEGKPLILKDEYGRVELAVNRGSFAGKWGLSTGDSCRITKE